MLAFKIPIQNMIDEKKARFYQYYQCNNVGKDTLGVKILCIMIHPRRICVTNSQVRLRGRGEGTPTVNPVVVNIQTSSLGPFIQRTRKFPSIAPPLTIRQGQQSYSKL